MIEIQNNPSAPSTVNYLISQNCGVRRDLGAYLLYLLPSTRKSGCTVPDMISNTFAKNFGEEMLIPLGKPFCYWIDPGIVMILLTMRSSPLMASDLPPRTAKHCKGDAWKAANMGYRLLTILDLLLL